MKNLSLLILAFLFICANQALANTPPCDCKSQNEKLAEHFKKGDYKAFLSEKAAFNLTLLNDRIAIMDYYFKSPSTKASKKQQIQSATYKLQLAHNLVYTVYKNMGSLKVESSGDFYKVLNSIQENSGASLEISSAVLYGEYRGMHIPYKKPPKGGNPNCEEGESPPAIDCGSVAAGVNNECLDGIQTKQECGYYATEGGQDRYEHDMNECNSAIENARDACQRAVETCDNYYTPPMGGAQDFNRRAYLACRTIGDNVNNPLQTETSTGN